MIVCPRCKTGNRDGSNFCNECGAPLGGAVAPPLVPPDPLPPPTPAPPSGVPPPAAAPRPAPTSGCGGCSLMLALVVVVLGIASTI